MKMDIKGYVDLTFLKGFVDLTVILDQDACDISSLPESHGASDAIILPSKCRAGEDLKRGEAVYIDPLSRAFKASAKQNCGGDDSFKSQVMGFVKDDAPLGAEVTLVRADTIFPQIDSPLVVGKCIYLSVVPGKVSSKMPTEPGTFRLKLGVARRSDEIAVNIGEPIFNS